MAKKYVVTLTTEELTQIHAMNHKGRVAVRKLLRANILRLANERCADEEIAETLETSVATIERIRQKFVLGGLDWAITDEPRLGAPRKLDGKQAAFLVALACSEPPRGHACWTMELLAERMLTLKVAKPPLSDETVRRELKKTTSGPGCAPSGASRPSAPNLFGAWKTSWTSMPSPMIRGFPSYALMNYPIS